MSPSPISCTALSSHQKGNETLARLAGGRPDGCEHGAEPRGGLPTALHRGVHSDENRATTPTPLRWVAMTGRKIATQFLRLIATLWRTMRDGWLRGAVPDCC
jgi:hypothetical protein